MMDFTTNNPVPAIHKISGKFRNVNYFRTRLKDNYIYYFEEQLKGINTSEYTFQSFDLSLNKNANFCPECKNLTLNFNLLSFTD